jgi:hypothetical protein
MLRDSATAARSQCARSGWYRWLRRACARIF